MNEYRTQRVTAKDLQGGRIRIPSSNTAKTKSIFPREKSRVIIQLRGQELSCSYDPRMGPDRQRSGLIQIGPKLKHIVSEDEVLTVSKDSNNNYVIE